MSRQVTVAGSNRYCQARLRAAKYNEDFASRATAVYGEDITIRFNRPTYVYVWFQVGVTLSSSINTPTNYADLIKETILECMEEVEAGSDVVPQRFTTELYRKVAGIDYFDIRLFSSEDSSASPSSYTERSVSITARQRAITSESRIGVVIDG